MRAIPFFIITLVILGFWIAHLIRERRELVRLLEARKDPLILLSRKERRRWAREQLTMESQRQMDEYLASQIDKAAADLPGALNQMWKSKTTTITRSPSETSSTQKKEETE